MKKKPTYAGLKRKLDSLFSEWIRRKDAGAYGRAMCVSCGMVSSWNKGMQCGHYISRNYLAGRWNSANCFVQCVACNQFRRGNYPAFSAYLNKTFGPQYIEELLKLKRKTVKLYRSDLEAMIETYKSKLEAL